MFIGFLTFLPFLSSAVTLTVAASSTQYLQCRGSQTYNLVVAPATPPTPVVNGPPYTFTVNPNLALGAVHSAQFILFNPDVNARPTVELQYFVAESNRAPFVDYLQYNLGRSVGQLIVPTSATTAITLTADEDHPYLSLIVSVPGSPDWFVGVRSLDMCDHNLGQWLNVFSQLI